MDSCGIFQIRETVKLFKKIARDFLFSLHDTQLEGETYLKIKENVSNKKNDFQEEMIHLLSSIKMQSQDNFETVVVHSKYLKKLKRLYGDLQLGAQICKKNLTSNELIKKQIDTIRFLFSEKIYDPITQLLKIIRYQLLACTEEMRISFYDNNDLLSILLDLLACENAKVEKMTAEILYFIMQRFSGNSTTFSHYNLLSNLLGTVKKMNNSHVNMVQWYILELICIGIDLCSEADLRKFNLRNEIKLLSLYLKNIKDAGVTKIFYLYSKVIYVSPNVNNK